MPCRSSTSCVTTSRRPACPSPRRSPTLPIAWVSSSVSLASLKTDAKKTNTKKTGAKAGLTPLTIHELIDAYRAGTTTPTAATEAYLARIAAHDEKVGAFLTVTREQALAKAHAADERYRKGIPRGPLDGA